MPLALILHSPSVASRHERSSARVTSSRREGYGGCWSASEDNLLAPIKQECIPRARMKERGFRDDLREKNFYVACYWRNVYGSALRSVGD